MIKFANEKEIVTALMSAMKEGNEAQMTEAAQSFRDAIVDQMKEDFKAAQESNDAAVLAQRGYRQLTAKENAWYKKVIDALRSPNPRQAFATIIGSSDEDDIMPNTILEDVYTNLVDQHPLLQAIDFQYVGYLTKWIMNDHTKNNAVWGAITASITEEITSAFKVVDVKQCKLSAYAFIERGMLDLGPTFLDGYIRTVLAEALAGGLEEGIIKGNGLNQPIGLIKDIHESVTVNSSTGYPDKSATAVTSFTPEDYGALLSSLSTTESGAKRYFPEVTLICNQAAYLTKIMPATTVMTANGTYATNLFPFPTKVIVSNEVADNRAILAVLPEYKCFVGGDQGGVIEYSDDYKFIEDLRYFKIKQYATGRAFDNTSALYLDISGLEPAYVLVKDMATTPSA